MTKKWRRISIRGTDKGDNSPIPIVGDAAIASRGTGDGRLIPLIIIDTSSRPDIDDFIDAHAELPPGDVKSQWGRPSWKKDRVLLLLLFQRPSKCLIIVEFNVAAQGILVEQTLAARALCLQAGRPGDRYVTTMDKPRIIVEIPEMGFDLVWDKMFRQSIKKDLRRRGLNRKEAAKAGQEAIRQMRRLGYFRLPS